MVSGFTPAQYLYKPIDVELYKHEFYKPVLRVVTGIVEDDAIEAALVRVPNTSPLLLVVNAPPR